MINRNLGNILLLNLVLNTTKLQNLSHVFEEECGKDTLFAGLSSSDLYSRLVSNTKFNLLSEEDKLKFLFVKKGMENEVNKTELHDFEMQSFATEAHNRTSSSLKTSRTNIVFCNFNENKMLKPDDWLVYDGTNGNIYINLDKDYSVSRPSFLLECINTATRQHNIYQSIFKILKQPESFSDREYFLALSTAVKDYVYQELKENDPCAYKTQMEVDYSTPDKIETVLYGFEKTRKDFQSAGIYGGEIRNGLRSNEQTYHEHLQRELVANSLVNMEDIFSYFEETNLNQNSNGMLSGILKAIVKQTAPSFYNSIGADMEKGQTITDYIDTLEEEMFEEYGLEVPEGDELEEFMGTDEYIEQQQSDIMFTKYGSAYKANYSEEDDEENEENEEEMPSYRKMDDVMPEEGKIDPIVTLPFQNYSQISDIQQ